MNVPLLTSMNLSGFDSVVLKSRFWK